MTPVDEERWLRRELAAVYRLVEHFGMADLIYTHISARLPGAGDRFLINPFGLLFEEITASALIEVGLDGQALAGPQAPPVNPAGFVIHSAIHDARPDVGCVLHTHSLAGSAVGAQADGLLPLNQVSMEFYGRLGYHSYEGVSLDLDEQARLVADLGSHHSMILRNHGLLTVGRTPGRAFLRMYYLERACQLQIAAQSGGGRLVIPEEKVIEKAGRQLNYETVAGDDFVDDVSANRAWAALLRRADRVAPGYAD
jgi:ribulose-5-phosphate 4-epimerase/fuculose-1-phosphate aldolase